MANKKASFAAGCFWGVEARFRELPGVATLNRQGPDRGTQYRSAVFWHEAEQERAASNKISALNAAGTWQSPIVTEVRPASTFWRAEEYHQRYLEKNGGGVCHV